MSYDFSGYVSCPALQNELNNEFLFNPTQVQDAIGMLRLINDPLNSNGIMQREVAPGNGKVRQLQLVYQPRRINGASDSAVINCAGGEEDGETSTTYELDINVGKSFSWTITPKLLAVRCQENAAYLAQQVQRNMDYLARTIDQELNEFAADNLGEFINGDTSMDVQTKNLTSGLMLPDLWEEVIAQMQFIEWPFQPFIFGDGELTKYMRAVQAACCYGTGMNLGDFAQQNPLVFMRDVNTANALGNSNAFLAMGPGSIQMLRYHEFDDPISKMNTDQLVQDVIVDPKTGIMYDYLAKYDCGVWNFQLKLAYKFVTLPEDVYYAQDRLAGTNGLLKFVINNS